MATDVIPADRTVLIDMDGVMADFEAPNNAIIRKHFPDVRFVDRRPDFYFQDTYAEHEKLVARLEQDIRKPGFFEGFAIIDGALDGWQRIIDAGYTPRVCSSPLQNHDTVIAEKIAWLEKHFVPVFGRSVVDNAIFDRDKSGYDAIAIIDDRPTLRNIGAAAWQHIVFDASYNQSTATDFRLHGWHDPELERLLARARAQYLAR